MENIFIPERFKKVIALHIIKNQISVNIKPSLILGIHGPSGEGKTFQCEHILNEMNIRTFLISGGQLESPNAGEPAQLIRATYIEASKSVENLESTISVVLINDIDTGLGNWGDMVQYTINRQTVFGELMHIVDYPTKVEGRITKRIPIIVTGNDFTKLYEPLLRAGRMTAFEWRPTILEKSKSVSLMFPEIPDLNSKVLVEELDKFLQEITESEYNSLPLAFYSHLKTSLYDEHLWNKITEQGLNETLEYISNGIEPNLNLCVTLDFLIKKGKNIIESEQLLNHLKS